MAFTVPMNSPTIWRAILCTAILMLISSCSPEQSTISDTSNIDRSSTKTKQIKWSELHVAVADGDEDKVRSLLAGRCDVNVAEPILKITPLHLAAESGNVEIVELLLCRGANPNAQEAQVGATPLHVAVQGGNLEVIDRYTCQVEYRP